MIKKIHMIAKKSDPKLWQTVKDQVTRSTKGGPAGKWSARKAQLAVKIYKSRGGKYVGKKSPKNSLTIWTQEDWGYIDEGGKKNGKKYGRYLPRSVRDQLTPKEKKLENTLKNTQYGKWISYSPSVAKKFKSRR